MKFPIFTFVTLLGLIACQQNKLVNHRQGPRAPTPISASSAVLSQGVNLKIEGNEADAFDYTFGSQALLLSKINAQSPSELTVTRQVAVQSPGELEPEFKAALGAICRNIGLSTAAQQYAEANTLPADGRVFVQWRSHFSLTQKRQLAGVLEKIKAPMRCLLKIQLGPESAGQFASVAFDPIPLENQKVAGTAKADAAIDEGIMLIDEEPKLEGAQILPVTDAADIKPMIAAINQADFKIKLKNSSGETCRYHKLASQTKVGNPTAVHSYEYGVEGGKAFSLGAVRSQSVSGQTLAACEHLKTKVAEKNFLADVACGTYRSIQDEGREAACQWTVEVVNPSDADNALGYNVGMEKIAFETVDVGTAVGAASVIPESARNPVRAKTTDFVGFSPEQLASMEQAFDFWIAVSPKAYDTYFDKYVTRVSYLGLTGPDCSEAGVLAFVLNLSSTEIYWCEAAGMSANAVMNQNSPLAMMLIGVTAFHENLHTRGREHDFDAPQYLPCAGTSESAQLSFDAIKTCKEDYCLAFKDFALQEYKSELDYSLQADARRFQGQCQIWNDGLGLKATDFRT